MVGFNPLNCKLFSGRDKEVFCQRTCRPENTTFNFGQPHPKPTHHPKIILNISLQSNLFTLHLPNNVKSNKRQ